MTNNIEYAKDKLQELLYKTIEGDFRYDGKLKNIDYFSALCKASSNGQMIKFLGSNLCMFNCRYNNLDSVLMIFAIPLNPNDDGEKKNSKHISERIMDIVKTIEESLIHIDYMNSEQIKEDKFTYLTVIKSTENKDIRNV